MSVGAWIAVGAVVMVGVFSLFDRQDSYGRFHDTGTQHVTVWAILSGIVALGLVTLGVALLAGWL